MVIVAVSLIQILKLKAFSPSNEIKDGSCMYKVFIPGLFKMYFLFLKSFIYLYRVCWLPPFTFSLLLVPPYPSWIHVLLVINNPLYDHWLGHQQSTVSSDKIMTPPLSSHQLPIAIQYGWGLRSPSSMLELWLAWCCAGNQSCCEWVQTCISHAMARSQPFTS